MRNFHLLFVALFAATLCCSGQVPKPIHEIIIPTKGYTSPIERVGMQLVWRDEFDGSEMNKDFWSHETGGHGWGNNELQFYQESNAIVQDGHLIVQARKESSNGRSYTSSRIISKGKAEFQYGRLDVRASLPKGQGIWPAIWMLGNDISTVDWPACGEIDIMEMIGGAGRENTVHGTIHWQQEGKHTYLGGKSTLTEHTYSDEFHVFSILWTKDSITWFVDDKEYFTTPITSPEMLEFHHKFYILFNVAVGGNWPGSPDEQTTFPQSMIVDYVRLYK